METISVGILGYNEAFGIARLLDSFQNQTLLQQSVAVEVIVISNGSQDNMAAVARDKIAALAALGARTNVIELPVADKCGAWNYLIHQATQPAEYYILLDADVELVNPQGLEELVAVMKQHPECRICGGRIVNQQGELSGLTVDGKCYIIRGDIVRDIHIPRGIVLDDAYVVSTAVTNWYETEFAVGETKGYVRQSPNVIVRCGGTPRDRDKSYWLASRKRTITSQYTQYHIDHCMRAILGGGELARAISMKLFATNPDWFLQYLNQVSVGNYKPAFRPPKVPHPLALKDVAQYLIYCYCYLLSVNGIRNQEFGHLAWKLKHRYW
ncbi:MAG: glycosyltransferase family 2 protein [Synechococcales cyanobacterium M58_A2018_015]|nr:glycosyltransferase family 2 protein [Synechococcales cyanobacterium M58_A2018_015]